VTTMFGRANVSGFDDEQAGRSPARQTRERTFLGTILISPL
jgi:hypothetical protein